MANDLMVKAREVTKLYAQGGQDVRALDRVDLDVRRGEFCIIMGPSGSGKSTLLHLIGGLDTVTEGEIEVAGMSVSRLNDDQITLFRRRKIGVIFQFFNLLPTLTVEENVALPLLLDGARLGRVRATVEALLDRVGLARRRAHRPDELSGGEMQRVAIARALVIEPALLLADEPTGNLDSQTGTEILDLLTAVMKERGHTTIMVTHDAKAARRGDRVVTLEDGRITDSSGGTCARFVVA